MPQKPVAVILAKLLTVTSPNKEESNRPFAPYPVVMPDGELPLEKSVAPALIVPEAVTLIVLFAAAGTAVEKFCATIPALPEVIVSPTAIDTEMAPVPVVLALMP